MKAKLIKFLLYSLFWIVGIAPGVMTVHTFSKMSSDTTKPVYTDWESLSRDFLRLNQKLAVDMRTVDRNMNYMWDRITKLEARVKP